MAIREGGIEYSATVATTDEQECCVVRSTSQAQRGGIAFVKTSGAGTLKFKHGFSDGDYRIFKTETIAASSTDCDGVDFDFICPDMKITWTSDSGSSCAVKVEVFLY
tara:strand:- start:1291 stop:1611 length:321 start_codon:yes stop_codon:yes gene_type:complete